MLMVGVGEGLRMRDWALSELISGLNDSTGMLFICTCVLFGSKF